MHLDPEDEAWLRRNRQRIRTSTNTSPPVSSHYRRHPHTSSLDVRSTSSMASTPSSTPSSSSMRSTSASTYDSYDSYDDNDDEDEDYRSGSGSRGNEVMARRRFHPYYAEDEWRQAYDDRHAHVRSAHRDDRRDDHYHSRVHGRHQVLTLTGRRGKRYVVSVKRDSHQPQQTANPPSSSQIVDTSSIRAAGKPSSPNYTPPPPRRSSAHALFAPRSPPAVAWTIDTTDLTASAVQSPRAKTRPTTPTSLFSSVKKQQPPHNAASNRQPSSAATASSRSSTAATIGKPRRVSIIPARQPLSDTHGTIAPSRGELSSTVSTPVRQALSTSTHQHNRASAGGRTSKPIMNLSSSSATSKAGAANHQQLPSPQRSPNSTPPQSSWSPTSTTPMLGQQKGRGGAEHPLFDDKAKFFTYVVASNIPSHHDDAASSRADGMKTPRLAKVTAAPFSPTTNAPLPSSSATDDVVLSLGAVYHATATSNDATSTTTGTPAVIMRRAQLDRLIQVLRARGVKTTMEVVMLDDRSRPTILLPQMVQEEEEVGEEGAIQLSLVGDRPIAAGSTTTAPKAEQPRSIFVDSLIASPPVPAAAAVQDTIPVVSTNNNGSLSSPPPLTSSPVRSRRIAPPLHRPPSIFQSPNAPSTPTITHNGGDHNGGSTQRFTIPRAISPPRHGALSPPPPPSSRAAHVPVATSPQPTRSAPYQAPYQEQQQQPTLPLQSLESIPHVISRNASMASLGGGEHRSNPSHRADTATSPNQHNTRRVVVAGGSPVAQPPPPQTRPMSYSFRSPNGGGESLSPRRPPPTTRPGHGQRIIPNTTR